MRKGIVRKLAAFAFAAVLCLGLFALPAAATADTPSAVLAARDGVVRVITMLGDGYIGMGTGFAVGLDGRSYIATNHHVIEGYQSIYVFYDTGSYVEAIVQQDDPTCDIAILRPLEDIPGLKVLPVRTDVADSGMAVYALGFPGAADTLSDGFEYNTFDTEEEYLRSVVASKPTMTITNGIVSAIRESALVSYEDNLVKIIQTNTAINKGNSGGPLLDSSGNVIGVNTLGLSGMEWHIEAMNGAVHAEALAEVLDGAGIRFLTPGQAEGGDVSDVSGAETTPAGQDTDMLLIIVLAAGAAVLIAIIVVIILLARRKGGGRTLAEFEAKGEGLDEPTVVQMARALVVEITPLAAYDLTTLLTPDNLVVDKQTLSLKQRGAGKQPGGRAPVVPGLSAPEVYEGRTGQPAAVYTVGAVMYTLLAGQRPADALARKQAGTALYPMPADTMQRLVNHLTALPEAQRVSTIEQLRHELDNAVAAIFGENGQALR